MSTQSFMNKQRVDVGIANAPLSSKEVTTMSAAAKEQEFWYFKRWEYRPRILAMMMEWGLTPIMSFETLAEQKAICKFNERYNVMTKWLSKDIQFTQEHVTEQTDGNHQAISRKIEPGAFETLEREIYLVDLIKRGLKRDTPSIDAQQMDEEARKVFLHCRQDLRGYIKIFEEDLKPASRTLAPAVMPSC